MTHKTESLIILGKNIFFKTNHIKAKITQNKRMDGDSVGWELGRQACDKIML